MTLATSERYLSGDHWRSIFDYLNIHSLLTLSRSARVFHQQLGSSQPLPPSVEKSESKREVSSYLSNRVLRSILAPYFLENPSFTIIDFDLLLPAVIKTSVTGDLTSITFTVFNALSHLIQTLHEKYTSIKGDTTPPSWSIDKSENNDHLFPIHGFFKNGAAGSEKWYNWDDANTQTPYHITKPDFQLPFDASLIFRYFLDSIPELDSDGFRLGLWKAVHNDTRERFYGDPAEATEGDVDYDWAGGWVLRNGIKKLMIPCGWTGCDDSASELFLDCTPGGGDTYGALFTMTTNSYRSGHIWYLAPSLTDFLWEMVQRDLVGEEGAEE
ncbi:hypothetical protein HK097_011601, partial [Rhizophlyctis rosea]